MTSVSKVFPVIFPVLVMAIAVVLLCFYLCFKNRIDSYDVTIPTQDGNASSALHTISMPEDQAEVDRDYDRLPPQYDTVSHPPPYSLFDPKLTSVWAGEPPPVYEMYPIALPLAPHNWMTLTGALHPVPPPSTRNRPQPQRSQQASTG